MSADRPIPGADNGFINRISQHGVAAVAGLATLAAMMGACDNGPANTPTNAVPTPTPNEQQLRERVAKLEADKRADEDLNNTMLITSIVMLGSVMLAAGAIGISEDRKRKRRRQLHETP